MAGWATQIQAHRYSADLERLPVTVRRLVQKKVDEMGTRLNAFSHSRLTGETAFRLRVGDYRVLYSFDSARGRIFLLSVGHRREIYKI